jgi:hypothetical protein
MGPHPDGEQDHLQCRGRRRSCRRRTTRLAGRSGNTSGGPGGSGSSTRWEPGSAGSGSAGPGSTLGRCWPPPGAGRADFGDGRFREGRGVLVDAFNARDDDPAFARIVFSDLVVSLLVNRLKIQADLTRHPEILDLARLGTECAEELAWRSERMIAARTALDPVRFLDVSYERMVADPISTIREACRHFGYEFSPEYEARARRYIAENPRHKHGVHRYRLEDFGLDEATVNHQFAAYRHWLAGLELVAACRSVSSPQGTRSRAEGDNGSAANKLQRQQS